MPTHFLSFDAAAWAQIWQVTALAVVVGLLVRLACRHRPQLAYLLWLLVIAKCLTPPLWSSPTGVFSWARTTGQAARADVPPRTPSASVDISLGETDLDLFLPSEQVAGLPSAARKTQPAQAAADSSASWARTLAARLAAAAWVAGMAAVAVVIAVKRYAWRRLLARSALAADDRLAARTAELARRIGLGRSARVLVTARPIGPAACGWWWPTIVLPQFLLDRRDVTGLDPLLAHELAHLRRCDPLVANVQLVAQAIWWFHPLIWWASRELRRERERSCDEEVVSVLGCPAADYARSLVDVLEWRQKLVTATGVPGVRPWDVTSARLAHILDRAPRFRRRTPWWCFALFAVAVVAVLPGAGLKLAAGPREALSEDQRPPERAIVAPPVAVDENARAAQGTQNPKSPEEELFATPEARAAKEAIERAGGRVYVVDHESSIDAAGSQRRKTIPPYTRVQTWEEWKGGDAPLARLRDLPRLEALYLDCRLIADQRLGMLTELKELKDLTLVGVQPAGLATVAGLDRLRAMALHKPQITDADLKHLAGLTNLERLTITDTPISPAGMAQLKNLRNLTSLTLQFDEKIGVDLPVLANFTRLQYLFVMGWQLTDSGMKNLEPLDRLRQLDLDANQLTDAGAASLAKLKSLQSLTFLLSDAQRIGPAGLAVLGRLENLRSLQPWGATITDAALASWSKLARLRNLQLDKCQITDAGLAALKGMTELRILVLDGDCRITDDGLANFEGLKKLRHLSLPGDRLAGAGLAHLESLSRLESLKLRGAPLRDEGLRHLAGPRQLKYLSLPGSRIEEDGLAALTNLTSLVSLDLSGTAITDAGLAIIGRLPQLEKLNLDETKISDAGLDHLKGLAKLQNLYTASTNVSNEGRVTLSKVLPRLEENLFNLRAELNVPIDIHDALFGEDEPRETAPLVVEQSQQPAPAPADHRQGQDPSVVALPPAAEEPAASATSTKSPEAKLFSTPEAREAKAEIERFGGIVNVNTEDFSFDSRRRMRGKPVPPYASAFIQGGWKGGDRGVALLRDLPNLQLVFVDLAAVSPKALDVLKDLKALRRLILGGVTGEGLEAIAGLTQLDSLSLHNAKFANEDLKHLAGLVNLERLDVYEAAISDAGLAHLKNLRKLNHLMLNSRTKTKVNLPVLAGFTQLVELNVTGLEMTDAALKNIAAPGELTYLLLDAGGLTDAGLASLAGLKQLEVLTLLGGEQLGPEGLAQLGGVASLRAIVVPEATITDKVLDSWQRLSQLRALLANNCRITDAGLASLARLTELRSVELGRRCDVTDAGLAHLASLGKLQSLKLRGNRLTDACAVQLEKLPRLKALHLTDEPVTNAAVRQIADLRQLTDLSLSGTRIDDAGLEPLANLTSLVRLDLNRTAITDAGLAVVGRLTKLEDLNLGGTKITDAGLDQLKGLVELDNLTTINTKVSEQGRKALAKTLPKLAELMWDAAYPSKVDELLFDDEDKP